jgi:NAD(P)-dependent dehydrogenase (short-subunit alcohol dehydrogenase family)
MRQQRSGQIALFGSVGSWRGGPAAGLYCATKWAVSGLAESLRLEVAPFGIGVCVIEPGYFRTGFLNAGARVQTKQRIKDYDESAVGQVRAFLEQVDNKQPGNLELGMKVIVDVFSLATVKEVPLRLVLGSDARVSIAEKCTSTLQYLEEEKGVIDGTDYPKGE